MSSRIAIKKCYRIFAVDSSMQDDLYIKSSFRAVVAGRYIPYIIEVAI